MIWWSCSLYGRLAVTRVCARRILAAETISIARVICDMLATLRMRRRISRVLAKAVAPPKRPRGRRWQPTSSRP